MFRTHEETGRKAVYVNRLMTVGIEGMPQAEAEPLLEAVFDHAEKPEFVYEHVWRVGDLLLWDNRCSSHARRDFPSTERRLMLRTTVKGSVRPDLMRHARGDCVGGCNLRGMSRRRADLSEPADRAGGAVRRRRHHRHRRAADRAAALRPLGAAGHRQQPSRRRQLASAPAWSPRPRPTATRLLVTTIAFAINASLQKQPYDAVKDFAPITEIASIPLMLVVHNSLPVHNVKEFIEYSKSQPAGLDYATSGPGTSTHLAAEMFKTMTGANLVHVPFKGNAEVLNALLGGHVKVHFALTASTLQHVRSGALRVLAVTTEKRLPELPDVPTIAELGYPGYEISSWQGVFAPAGTPKDIIDKLNGEIVAMLQDAGGAGADHPRGRRSGRQLARAMVRAVQERSGESGPRWPKAPGCQPRTERVAHMREDRQCSGSFATSARAARRR